MFFFIDLGSKNLISGTSFQRLNTQVFLIDGKKIDTKANTSSFLTRDWREDEKETLESFVRSLVEKNRTILTDLQEFWIPLNGWRKFDLGNPDPSQKTLISSRLINILKDLFPGVLLEGCIPSIRVAFHKE